MKSIIKLSISIAIISLLVSCSKEKSDQMPYFIDIPFDDYAKINADMGVDLGTGVLWRSGNLGAKTADEIGDYYAWGALEYPYIPGTFLNPQWKDEKNPGFRWDNCPIEKYHTDPEFGEVDNLLTLLPNDDVATQLLGKKWRIPSYEDWARLVDQPDIEWKPAKLNSKFGILVISHIDGYDGNYIFLPGTNGYYMSTSSNMESYAHYWSSTLHLPEEKESTCAYCLRFAQYKGSFLTEISINSHISIIGTDRYHGLAIRPVYDK